MATLTDLAADVYTITNRPDLIQETKVAIRKAIRKFHGADTFKRDLKQQRLAMATYTPVAEGQYRWSIPLDEFTRFRRMSDIRYPPELMPPENSTVLVTNWAQGYSVSRQFTEIAANNIFDTYRAEKQNYYFVAGASLTIKSGWYVDYLDVLYYQWPEVPIDETTPFSTWIVDQFPDAIQEEASAMVFKMIGKDDEFQRFNVLFGENLQIIRGTDIGESV